MTQTSEETTISISETVSNNLETPIDELPLLSDSINLDALNEIVTADPSHDVTVVFRYAGLRVLVHSGNTIYVHPLPDEQEDGSQNSTAGLRR